MAAQKNFPPNWKWRVPDNVQQLIARGSRFHIPQNILEEHLRYENGQQLIPTLESQKQLIGVIFFEVLDVVQRVQMYHFHDIKEIAGNRNRSVERKGLARVPSVRTIWSCFVQSSRNCSTTERQC